MDRLQYFQTDRRDCSTSFWLKMQNAFEDTLWCTTVLLSSPTMSIPNSTWSSDLSSYGSLSSPSDDSRSPFTNVPFDDLTSLIQIWRAKSKVWQQ